MKKKIFFVIPNISAGGAERVMSFVAQQLDSNIFDVKVIVIGFEKNTVFDVYNVEVVYLNKTRLLSSIFSFFYVLAKEKPSVVISSIGHVNMMMGMFSLMFRKIKFIGREASIISRMNEFSKVNSMLSNILTHYLYNKLSVIICQSIDMRYDLVVKFGIDSAKLPVIHNPITSLNVVSRQVFDDKIFRFVTVGRLSEEKGYLRIIEGLSKINKYDFQYTIIGSGNQESVIKEKLGSCGLGGKVKFIPYTSKVLQEISENDFFLQGSYVEGFPNALLESCTVGTPVIAFKAPGGTKDIVENGVNGFLVEDMLEFVSVLNDIDKLKSIDNDNVFKSVSEKFNSKKIISQYEDLIKSVL